MSIERYRHIVPEWDRFVDVVRTPEPTTVRVRADRVDPPALRERLAARGFTTEPVDGLPGFLRIVDGPHSVALTLEHWLGWFYVQQSVTGVAAPALDPRPGDRVLDLCAAPGGKTTHLSDLMDGRGCLVAADVSDGRLKGLQGNLTRLGISNVIAAVADGRRFPDGAPFDRILVDAPCSAEGNLRKKLGRLRAQKHSFRRHVRGLQEELLRRAVELVRPGGTILYVTCTFAPEENEGVVSRVLGDSPVRMQSVELPVPSAPGLATFEKERYEPSLALAHRLYPHHLDSGGLFLALLRKDGPEPAEHATPGWTPVPDAFPGDATDRDTARSWIRDGLARLADEFGVAPEALEGMGWMRRGDNGWMHTCDAWPVEAWEGADVRISSVGLRALSPDARDRPRPTNYLLQLLGPGVTRRRVELDAPALRRALRREPLPAPDLPPGHAALCLERQVVGRVSVGRAGLRHEIPKARARDLVRVLEAASVETLDGDG